MAKERTFTILYGKTCLGSKWYGALLKPEKLHVNTSCFAMVSKKAFTEANITTCEHMKQKIQLQR